MYHEIMAEQKKLDIAVKALRKTGTDYAQAERDYKVVLRQEALKLRDTDMAVGMIDKVVYGIPVVAEARFKRDVAEAVYKANLESINAIKLTIKVMMNQYDKEFSTAQAD